jgi:small subunit ribosomal protein S14
MARESVKARQRKREEMVAKYAAKRAALKAAGDFEALDKLPKNSSAVRLREPLPAYRPSKRLYASLRRMS